MPTTLLQKGQIRTAVQQAIDDPSGIRWSASNLDVLITVAQDTLFQAILDTFPTFTLAVAEAITTDASGAFDLTTTTQRFYRIIKVVNSVSSVELQPIYYTDKVPSQAYTIGGFKLLTIPTLATTALKLDYSYLPTRFTDLANDTTALPNEFPVGHESALIYLAAAWAMTKGDQASMAQIGRIADQAIEALLLHVARKFPFGTLQNVGLVKRAIMRNAVAAPEAPEQG